MPRTSKGALHFENVLSEDGVMSEVEAPKKESKIKIKEPESYTFELIGDFPIRDGVKKYPGMCVIPNTDIIVDEGSGSLRSIRYLVGVASIYVDEQGDLDPKTVRRLTPKRFEFDNGKMIVDARNKAMLSFMRLSNRNQDVKNRAAGIIPLYREVDNGAAERKALERLRISQKAGGMAASADADDMIAHAKYLGISLYNEHGLEKTEEGLMADYIKYAQDRPDLFMNTFKNPLVKTYTAIRDALEQGILTLTHVKGQAHWADTKAFIVAIPEGKHEIEFLASYALTDAGKSFKERVQELVK